MTDTTWHRAFPVDELADGTMRAVVIGAREILILKTRAGCFALDNTCTHAEARMVEGRLRGTRLVCPLHGACYDVRDGKVLGGPATLPIASHALRVVGRHFEVGLES